jgi:hypothetical protein
LGAEPSAATLTIGLNGELGFGKPEGGTIWSATAGLPVALVAGAGSGLRLAPFLTPAFGFGYVTGQGESESGTRMLLGGGVGIMGANRFGVSVGFQKVFIEDGQTTIGINASFRM